MKNIIFVFILISCFISCKNKKKFEGKWTNWTLKNYGYNETKNVVIQNDSIKFNYTAFNFWNKYPLTIEKGKFKFNNITLKGSIEKDTLTFNDSIHFIKDDLDTLYDYKPLLKIELPQISKLIKTSKKENNLISYLYYGKRIDNGEFGLQLNDKYAKLKDIPAFLNYERTSTRCELSLLPSTYLIIDKTTPMKYLEDIFYNLSIINKLKICFINNITINFNDSLGLYYEYERLMKKLPPYRENDNYNTNTSSEKYSIPPPPPLALPLFDKTTPEIKFIYLKKDKIYFKNEIIKPEDLRFLIKPWIKKNNVIFSLYDLESTYCSFLEMNAIINNTYEDVREKESKLTFNKTLKELNKEKHLEIKMKIRMYHIWNYSIPHYNSIIKKNNSFFGLNAPLVHSKTSVE
ncbi:hypothetical protein [Thalassobellus citreus]|uniref:hypothetical protein n=1 Tax=Thalassobellus citreus TaxID=3367752 RepID=UPI0037A8F356